MSPQYRDRAGRTYQKETPLPTPSYRAVKKHDPAPERKEGEDTEYADAEKRMERFLLLNVRLRIVLPVQGVVRNGRGPRRVPECLL